MAEYYDLNRRLQNMKNTVAEILNRSGCRKYAKHVERRPIRSLWIIEQPKLPVIYVYDKLFYYCILHRTRYGEGEMC